MTCRIEISAFLLLLATSMTAAVADDWPQWMGPGRDNAWRESGLVERFPRGGPPVLWRRRWREVTRGPPWPRVE